MFDKCKELFSNLELDISDVCINRTHRIGKKHQVGLEQYLFFTIWRHRTMVYRKRKDCVNCRITLDLTKPRLDIFKEATDLARERVITLAVLSQVSTVVCVWNCLMARSSFSTLWMISIPCRVLYLLLCLLYLWISLILRVLEFVVIFRHFVKLCWYFLKLFYLFLTFFTFFFCFSLQWTFNIKVFFTGIDNHSR